MPEIISSGDAQNNFGALLDTAQRIPVIIQRRKRDCAVLVSMQEYEEWQKIKNARLQQATDSLGREAQARGLTPEILEAILKEPSEND